MSDFLVQNLRFLTRATETGGQAKVGSTAKVGQPAVSKIISGQTKEPGYRTVVGLARHFGIPLEDLLNRDLEHDGPSRASQPAGLDVAKLADLIETLESAIVLSGRPVAPLTKAKLVTQLYADDQAAGASRDAMQAMLVSILKSLE